VAPHRRHVLQEASPVNAQVIRQQLRSTSTYFLFTCWSQSNERCSHACTLQHCAHCGSSGHVVRSVRKDYPVHCSARRGKNIGVDGRGRAAIVTGASRYERARCTERNDLCRALCCKIWDSDPMKAPETSCQAACLRGFPAFQVPPALLSLPYVPSTCCAKQLRASQRLPHLSGRFCSNKIFLTEVYVAVVKPQGQGRYRQPPSWTRFKPRIFPLHSMA
jgi:hypothetical protein